LKSSLRPSPFQRRNHLDQITSQVPFAGGETSFALQIEYFTGKMVPSADVVQDIADIPGGHP
jgi:hypothetical protein